MGIISCVGALLCGSLIGIVLKNRITTSLKETMTVISGVCAIAMGIGNIIKANTVSVVVMSIIIGTIIGELLDLHTRIRSLLTRMLNKMHFHQDEEYMKMYLAVFTVFSFSGLGIFGAMTEGISGDGSILISKAILDLFCAVIFAAILGKATMLIAIPETMVLLFFFLIAKVIMPYINETMFSDFMACGGLLTLSAGLNIADIKNFKVINMVPALIIVFPISYFMAL